MNKSTLKLSKIWNMKLETTREGYKSLREEMGRPSILVLGWK